jgi:hypothetical protein
LEIVIQHDTVAARKVGCETNMGFRDPRWIWDLGRLGRRHFWVPWRPWRRWFSGGFPELP